MPLLRDDDLVRVDLPADGEWVEVKRRLSKGDHLRAQDAAGQGARVELDENGRVGGMVMGEGAVSRSTFAYLEVGIRRWSFDEPITPATIRMLDEQSYDAIVEFMNELYRPIGADEGKNLSANGITPISGKAASRPRSSA